MAPDRPLDPRQSRSAPSAERLAAYEDWERRLGKLCDEMERFFGEPGDNNQDPLDSAVHVAFYVAVKETEFWRRAARQQEAVDA